MLPILPPVQQLIAGYWMSVANRGGEQSNEVNTAGQMLREAGAALDSSVTAAPRKIISSIIKTGK